MSFSLYLLLDFNLILGNGKRRLNIDQLFILLAQLKKIVSLARCFEFYANEQQNMTAKKGKNANKNPSSFTSMRITYLPLNYVIFGTAQSLYNFNIL